MTHAPLTLPSLLQYNTLICLYILRLNRNRWYCWEGHSETDYFKFFAQRLDAVARGNPGIAASLDNAGDIRVSRGDCIEGNRRKPFHGIVYHAGMSIIVLDHIA